MPGSSIGSMFKVTTFGESHGPALGCIVDGCPPGIELTEADLQVDLDRRRPGTSKYTSQRKEADKVKILSGVFEGTTTGTAIGLMIDNTDQKSKDYSDIENIFRPGHADYVYHKKFGIRDHRGGGRASARETAMRVAAGGEPSRERGTASTTAREPQRPAPPPRRGRPERASAQAAPGGMARVQPVRRGGGRVRGGAA